MKKKFIVGDIIKYMGPDCRQEYNREQIVTEIRSHDGYLVTKFIDTGEKNGFDPNSVYHRYCEGIKYQNTWDGNVLKFRFV